VPFTCRTPPPETVRLPTGVLTRFAEADAEPVSAAVRASLAHLRPWMPWATEAAAAVDTQAERCRDAAKAWEDGTEYIYVLRADPDGPVVGTFGLHRRVGPGGIEIGY
jgi:RimJ/RimL family protein N-acetyltransferase